MTTPAGPLTDREAREIFVSRLELLSGEDFDAARELARKLRIPLERAIADRGGIPLAFLLDQLASCWGVKYTELEIGRIQPYALARIPEAVARRYGVVAFHLDGQQLSVAMTNPRDEQARKELQRLTGLDILPYLAQQADIHRALLLYRGELRGLIDRADRSATDHDDIPAPALLDRILEYAVVTGASDIHVEPFEHETLIRCRVDGVLRDVMTLSAGVAPPLAARIKALSTMRIDDRRSPQDGRFAYTAGGVSLQLRVSSLPTHWGEKVVMRILPSDVTALDLEALGLGEQDYTVVLRNLNRPFGMVLVTGPTGCGKSTTLYAMLMRLGAERRNLVNISTIEDPVEHPLPRVVQVSINPAAGIEFASGLRALLRQDPDVIMVGEIRDRETAAVAVRAALVGRLLLSTLHTNDTASAIPRLIDMGVEPFLLTSTLSVVIAQRLVRRICPACRESIPLDAVSKAMLKQRADLEDTSDALSAVGAAQSINDLDSVRVFRGRGCRQCENTGYRGRVGVFEVLEMNDDLRRLALARTDAQTLRKHAIAAGMRTMFHNGLAKVLLGETTIEEAVRVTN